MSVVFKTQVDAPDFNPDAWNDGSVDPRGSNCFQYAFAGSKSAKELDKSVPDPGGTAGGVFPFIINESSNILNALQLDHIKIVSKIIPDPKPGSYLVALYVAPNHDYHWVRQDSDGGWSEKPGTGTAVQRYLEPSIDGKAQPVPERYHDSAYALVGYAYAPKEGIALGLEKPIADHLKAHPHDGELHDVLNSLPPETIRRIQATLGRTNPEIAPLFAQHVDRYVNGEAERIATLLQKDITEKALGAFFSSNEDRPLYRERTKIIGDALAKTHPDLVGAYSASQDYFHTQRKAQQQNVVPAQLENIAHGRQSRSYQNIRPQTVSPTSSDGAHSNPGGPIAAQTQQSAKHRLSSHHPSVPV